MFRGISAINLDAKGRFAFPTRYRDALGDQVVVTIDTEATCLLLYPLPEWELIEKKLQALPSFNKAARRIQRLLIGHATDIELDDSGRLLLPKVLREYAKLDKEAILVGQGRKFELWDESSWQNSRVEWLSDANRDDEAGFPDDLQSLSL